MLNKPALSSKNKHGEVRLFWPGEVSGMLPRGFAEGCEVLDFVDTGAPRGLCNRTWRSRPQDNYMCAAPPFPDNPVGKL